MTKHNHAKKPHTPDIIKGFVSIAAWQFSAFLILFLLVWVNEFLDISALLYDTPMTPPDLTRACLASAGVLLAAIIAVGHTYVQQQQLIFGILTMCSYCHKIRISEEDWERVEEYVGKRSTAAFSHGICPACYEDAKKEVVDSPESKPDEE
ncbi:MAG: hypothetical protein HN341_01790 [Verrucomicrobia bacterium]|nr:hypothetical protein [Verrucomicrobiota bacterium]